MSGRSAIGSALALGARGCQFESGRPDHFSIIRGSMKNKSRGTGVARITKNLKQNSFRRPEPISEERAIHKPITQEHHNRKPEIPDHHHNGEAHSEQHQDAHNAHHSPKDQNKK